MFGRPSISRNTPLDKSVIRELMELHGTFSQSARNFVESNRVRSVARKASDDLDEAVAGLRYSLDALADDMIKLENAFMEIPADMREETQIDEAVGTHDHIQMIKRHVQRNYKKGDDITYVDSRDHETYTHEYKGIKNRGGNPYAAIETGRELLMIPLFQLVVDI